MKEKQSSTCFVSFLNHSTVFALIEFMGNFCSELFGGLNWWGETKWHSIKEIGYNWWGETKWAIKEIGRSCRAASSEPGLCGLGGAGGRGEARCCGDGPAMASVLLPTLPGGGGPVERVRQSVAGCRRDRRQTDRAQLREHTRTPQDPRPLWVRPPQFPFLFLVSGSHFWLTGWQAANRE